METIVGYNYDFEIPTPIVRMREIGAKLGWNTVWKESEYGVV